MLGALHAKAQHVRAELKKNYLNLSFVKDGKAWRYCFHLGSGIGPWSICSHPYSGGVHWRVLRRERRRAALGDRRGADVQVQRHQRHAHLLPGQERPAGARRQRHRPHHGRGQRPARESRRQRLQRGLLGAGQRQALPGQRQHQVHRRRQRGGRGRHPEHPPGHEEPQRRALSRRPRRHQGVHLGVLGRHRRVPSLHGHVQLRRLLLHEPHRAVSRQHRRAAPRQRVSLLLLRGEPGVNRHQVRALHVPGHGGAGRQQRVHEPVRRAGGHVLLGAGERRRRQRGHRGVGERVAVERGHRGEREQRADVQPEPDQPRRAGDAQEARRHGGLHIRHVQREQEDRG